MMVMLLPGETTYEPAGRTVCGDNCECVYIDGVVCLNLAILVIL